MVCYDYHFATIRHLDCLFKLLEPNSQCEHCKKFTDNVLRKWFESIAKKGQGRKRAKTRADSHTNFRALISSQKDERMKNLWNFKDKT